jgi:hypothetical protein
MRARARVYPQRKELRMEVNNGLGAVTDPEVEAIELMRQAEQCAFDDPRAPRLVAAAHVYAMLAMIGVIRGTLE